MGTFYQNLSPSQKSFFNFLLNESSEQEKARKRPVETMLLSCRRKGKLDEKLLFPKLSAYYGAEYSFEELIEMADRDLDRERGIR